MIRTVPIPTGVNRMGCAPGADCCAACASHGPTNLGAASGSGRRNAALHVGDFHLGDTTCDVDGNCYEVTESITYGAPASGGTSSPGTFQMNNTTAFMIAGVAIIALLEVFTRSGSSSRR